VESAQTRTLRVRFGIRAFLISLLVLGLFTAGLAVFWRARILDSTVRGLVEHIHSAEGELEILYEDGRFPPADEGEPFVLPEADRGVQVVSADNRVVAATEDLVDSTPAIAANTVLDNETTATTIVDHPVFGHAAVTAEPFELGGATYVVEAITDLEAADQACRVACLYVPIAALVVAALVGVAVSVSVRATLRPVHQITARAEEVAAQRQPERLGVTADSVELYRLATSLDHLLDEIRAAFDREQAFLDDASHELRTPVAIARAELELAQRGGPGTDIESALESAIEELDRVDATAGDLLVLARTRATGTEGFREVQLGEVAETAAALARRRSSRANVELSVNGSGLVLGDAAALERAFVNLIGNAVDHSSRSVEVTVTSSDEVVVTIADDGPGIPEHLLAHFFDRFTRADDQRKDSFGLGTAIAAEIVTVHGGTVDVANRDRGGAEVTVRLPALAAQEVS
jgi:signal transduction histidine kinase